MMACLEEIPPHPHHANMPLMKISSSRNDLKRVTGLLSAGIEYSLPLEEKPFASAIESPRH
jgi:hypothetical protein